MYQVGKDNLYQEKVVNGDGSVVTWAVMRLLKVTALDASNQVFQFGFAFNHCKVLVILVLLV